MKTAISILDRLPRLKKVLKSGYYYLQGLPPVTHSSITKEILQERIHKSNPTIIEIGSNDGAHTLWFDQIFEFPRIYCFEHEPRAIERFRKNVGSRSNITLFEVALSDREGSTTFYQSTGYRNENDFEIMPHGWDLSGSIRKPKEHLKTVPWVKFNQGINVKTQTLDGWCQEQMIDEIDFIWMDVQGAELDVLRGGKNAISRTRYLYTEYSNKELYEGQTNLKKLLRSLSAYEVIYRYPNDVLLRNKQMS